MEFGIHLPLIAFRRQTFSLTRLLKYAELAERLGFTTLCANDHLIWARPWLDSLTALTSVLANTRKVTLMTTSALPVVRGPAQLAKSLAAIDLLSGGRLIAGIAPGSSPHDYALVGVSFEERWKRFDEAVQLLRSLLQREDQPFQGRFYATELTRLEPFPAQESGPPIWIGSWGSDAGLRRVARLGDGWLASAYNITPASFADGLRRLNEYLPNAGKQPERFPNALGTMFFYVTDNQKEADEVFDQVLSRLFNHPVDQLRERLLVGAPAECAEKLAKLKAAGVQKVFLWPVDDENDLEQLTMFHEQIIPLIPS